MAALRENHPEELSVPGRQPRCDAAGQLAQGLALAGEMGAHGRVGAFGVARLERGEDGQVLGQALLQPAWRVQLLQPGQLDDLAQVAITCASQRLSASAMIAS